MGIDIEYKVIRHGFFPDVMGEVKLYISSLKGHIKPIHMTDRGQLKEIEIHTTYMEGNLQNYYLESFKPKLQEYLKELFKEQMKITFKEDESIKRGFKTKANTLNVTAFMRYENPTALAANVLIEGKDYNENTDYAEKLMKDIKYIVEHPNMCTDEHHTDQFLVYMALASGKSAIRTHDLSLHA